MALGLLDATTGDVVVAFLDFDSNKPAAQPRARNSSGAATHEGVEDGVSRRFRNDKLHYLHGLLCGVQLPVERIVSGDVLRAGAVKATRNARLPTCSKRRWIRFHVGKSRVRTYILRNSGDHLMVAKNRDRNNWSDVPKPAKVEYIPGHVRRAFE